MRLLYRLVITLAVTLTPILTIWVIIFYAAMVNEINDETDDSLEDYAETIVRRVLTRSELPSSGDGTNNTYTIELLPATGEYSNCMDFEDRLVYIPEKQENEPARVMTLIFSDENNRKYRLVVSTPTFERDDLLHTVLIHIVALYVLLLITIMTTTSLVFYFCMRPLYSLLSWLDCYLPGSGVKDMPTANSTIEFRKLTSATYETIERAEKYMERQKQFIGNASHELQTPLAVLGTRIEWLIDNTQLTEEQFDELSKMRHSLHRMRRLNSTLLLISKIDNAQFVNKEDVDLAGIITNELEIYSDIFADKDIRCQTELPQQYIASMDESLATTMLTNLLKNAFLHSPHGGSISVSIERDTLYVRNTGNETLDSKRVFDRFYTNGQSGSTGLGLALVKSISENYGFKAGYHFENNRHLFYIKFK